MSMAISVLPEDLHYASVASLIVWFEIVQQLSMIIAARCGLWRPTLP